MNLLSSTMSMGKPLEPTAMGEIKVIRPKTKSSSSDLKVSKQVKIDQVLSAAKSTTPTPKKTPIAAAVKEATAVAAVKDSTPSAATKQPTKKPLVAKAGKKPAAPTAASSSSQQKRSKATTKATTATAGKISFPAAKTTAVSVKAKSVGLSSVIESLRPLVPDPSDDTGDEGGDVDVETSSPQKPASGASDGSAAAPRAIEAVQLARSTILKHFPGADTSTLAYSSRAEPWICPFPSCGKLIRNKLPMGGHFRNYHSDEMPHYCPVVTCLASQKGHKTVAGIQAHLREKHPHLVPSHPLFLYDAEGHLIKAAAAPSKPAPVPVRAADPEPVQVVHAATAPPPVQESIQASSSDQPVEAPAVAAIGPSSIPVKKVDGRSMQAPIETQARKTSPIEPKRTRRSTVADQSLHSDVAAKKTAVRRTEQPDLLPSSDIVSAAPKTVTKRSIVSDEQEPPKRSRKRAFVEEGGEPRKSRRLNKEAPATIEPPAFVVQVERPARTPEPMTEVADPSSPIDVTTVLTPPPSSDPICTPLYSRPKRDAAGTAAARILAS